MTTKKLLRVLRGERFDVPPLWMMRQAGRHLPEYRELRARANGFLDFCYSPSLAAEATLQPIRRYGMDGAILFADILLILDAMGRKVAFVEGEGPKVEPNTTASDVERVPLAQMLDRLTPVYETVERVRSALPTETTLIGFAGAPWTVAVYAIEGRGGTDKKQARLKAYSDPAGVDALLDRIAEATAHYLARQVDAGADALMLFDSWAEGLSPQAFERLVIRPTLLIRDRLKYLGVATPLIGFPRGSGGMLRAYVDATQVDAVGLDTAIPPEWAHAHLPPKFPVQGNLDPLQLIAGGEDLDDAVRRILAAFKDRPHIFNLGHGVHPETPIAHVSRVVDLVRGA
ncbi:MAG: uroporphyrinogen decarboxylase [Pseudomonadota bacterium]